MTDHDPTPAQPRFSASHLPGMSRRQLLALGAGMVGAFALPAPAAQAQKSGKGGPPGGLKTYTGDFQQPFEANNLGTLDQPVQLSVEPVYATIDPFRKSQPQKMVAQRYYHMDGQGAFNHTSDRPIRPGPTFRFKASDPNLNTLNLKFCNNLPPNDCYPVDPSGSQPNIEYASKPPFPSTGCEGVIDKPKCFNTVNMHFHGFHVSPLSLSDPNTPVCGTANKDAILSSDDVLYALNPKGQDGSMGEHRYCVALPTFHAPGTHWYHDHTHGATALHVIDGMAGALIIEEEGEFEFKAKDGSPLYKKENDLIWLLQEVINADLTTQIPRVKPRIDKNSPIGYEVPTDQTVYNCGSNSKQFTVNGLYQPTLAMKTTDIHRWRFINATATPRGFIKIRLIGPQENGEFLGDQYLFMIASDGISFFGRRPTAVKSIDLAPANRADFLVQVLKPGTYHLVKEQVTIQGSAFAFPNAGPQYAQVLATVKVSGDDQTNAGTSLPFNFLIPGTAPEYLKPITEDQLLKNPDGSVYCRPLVFNIELEGKSQGCFFYPSEADPTPRGFQVNGQQFTEKTRGGYVSYEPQDLRRRNAKGELSIRDDNGKNYQDREYNTGEFKFVENDYREETVQVVKLNTCEEWILLNYSNLAHPFHIHVNPFQVVEIYDPNATGTVSNPQLKTFDVHDGVWNDTILIPAGRLRDTGAPFEPGYVKIRSRFWDYWGEYVHHCHILTHEDLGMMQNVYVVDDGTGQGPCKTMNVSRPAANVSGPTIGDGNTLSPTCYPPTFWPPGQPKPNFEVFQPLDKDGRMMFKDDIGTEFFPPNRGADCIPGGKSCETA